MEGQVPYAFTLTTAIPASAQEIYDAWLDSLAHSEMTGSEADMSDEIDAEVSAWDGYITGRNLELIPGERIVQSWRTTQFAEEHEDSIITLTFEEAGDGTLMSLVHSNVPDEQTSYELSGWREYYFEPMKKYFAKRTRARAAGRRAAAPKGKRVARTKSKRSPTKPKMAVGKKGSKRTITAGAKRRRAKQARRKAARGTSR
jgi:uncharacterized protein YndB with AHSA1/START domain